MIEVPLTISELTGPGPVLSAITPEDADLTCNAGTGGEAIGQRIIVTGRVLDDRGNPIPDTLLEVWQAFDAIDRLYVTPALIGTSEKNV